MSVYFFIGYDAKEDIAYRVCKYSLLKRTSTNVKITSLKLKGSKFEFVSSSRTTYSTESLLDSLGKRIPDFKTSQKHFKMLEIIITNKPLTEDEWEVFDKDAEWFAYKGSDENLVGNDFHKLMYNFYEATKGKGSITIGY